MRKGKKRTQKEENHNVKKKTEPHRELALE